MTYLHTNCQFNWSNTSLQMGEVSIHSPYAPGMGVCQTVPTKGLNILESLLERKYSIEVSFMKWLFQITQEKLRKFVLLHT